MTEPQTIPGARRQGSIDVILFWAVMKVAIPKYEVMP